MSKQRVGWRAVEFVTGIGGAGGGWPKQKVIVRISHGIAIRRVSDGREARHSPPGREPELRRLHLFASVRTRNEANVMTSVTQLTRPGEHRAEIAWGGPGGHEKMVRHRSITSETTMLVFEGCRCVSAFENGVTDVAAQRRFS
jgi:hypothetical protein